MTDSELFKVTGTAQALEALLGRMRVADRQVETVALEESLGRFLAHDVVSPEDIPPFQRSTMDGFAVAAADTFGASEGSPAYLKVAGRVLMGEMAGTALKGGEAAHIPTGGMLPPQADAVVMVEYTSLLDEQTVEITRPVAPGENVVTAGEDIARNETIFPAGRRLGPYDLGALAAIGMPEVEVFGKVTVGIVSTGDELVDAGETPGPGQVRDINYYALAALVKRSGGEPLRLGIVPDDAAALSATLRQALPSCRLLIISGGTSVGTADMTPAVIDGLGRPGVLTHGLSVKPGKPTIIALIDDVPVFGLPGHPVGALDIFDLMVEPVIRFLITGVRQPVRPLRLKARLARSLSSVAGREDRIRVSLEHAEDGLVAHPLLGKSGLISRMTRADGVAIIPFEAEGAARGEEVEVEPLKFSF